MSGKTKLALAAGFFGAVALASTAFGQTGQSGEQGDGGQRRARPAACGKPGRGHEAGLRGRLVHSDTKVQVKDGFAVLTADRGVITAVDAAAKTLTVKRADDETVTVTASDETKVCRNGEPAHFADLRVGDAAGILQAAHGDRHVVRAIRAFSPDYNPPGRSQQAPSRPGRAEPAAFANGLDI